MPPHFLIRVLPSKRPCDASLLNIAAQLPGIDLGNECGAAWQAPIKTLAIQDTDFDSAMLSQLACFGV